MSFGVVELQVLTRAPMASERSFFPSMMFKGDYDWIPRIQPSPTLHKNRAIEFLVGRLKLELKRRTRTWQAAQPALNLDFIVT